ncbi:hypothetical protein QQ045_000057 [Rhodiola kirilowii]
MCQMKITQKPVGLTGKEDNEEFIPVLSKSAQKRARQKAKRNSKSEESNGSGDTVSSTGTSHSRKEEKRNKEKDTRVKKLQSRRREDQKDKLNGNRVRDTDTVDFRKFLAITGLQDLPSSGYHYTWSNNHVTPADRIWCKLDRLSAMICGLKRWISDKSPVIVYWGEEKRINRNFRYCNFWENLDDYNDVIRRTWNNGTKCRNLFMIQTKLKIMKNMLKQDFVRRTRGMDKRVNMTRKALMEAQSKAESNPNDSGFCVDERKLALKFRKLKFNPFLFNKLRTNAQWIKEGDANTKFFHSLLKSRRIRISVNQITLQDGSVSTDFDTIKHEFSDYFKELLGQARVCNPFDSEAVAQGPVVTEKQCRSLRKWSTLGKELGEAVRHCLRYNAMPKGVNVIGDARRGQRPCCANRALLSTIGKVIWAPHWSGAVPASLTSPWEGETSRLKEVLPHIINPGQGAFVKDRSIVDNICLAQQLFNGYGRRNLSERVAWKIDLRKVYDTID